MNESKPEKPDQSDTLSDWLNWLEYLHSAEIDLGLDRVASVARSAGLSDNLPLVITVAGTNGKGSVVAMLTSIYTAAGYTTGSYTSPHLLEFNERICLNGKNTADQTIVDALCAIESNRQKTTLTYFEYTTLAAMHVFQQAGVDIAILEVGLGGRLDAVNIWDTDCAILTSIAIDHESWLGDNRESVGGEKVAIARTGKPLIVADIDPPMSVIKHVNSIGADYRQVERDYLYSITDDGWQLRVNTDSAPEQEAGPEAGPETGFEFGTLPRPSLAGAHQYGNAAAAVMAVHALRNSLPVTPAAIREGLVRVVLPGRFDHRQYKGVEIIVDVAHNPAAAGTLAAALAEQVRQTPDRPIHAVVSMMADKDIEAVISLLLPYISSWHCGQLSMPRALSAEKLKQYITTVDQKADIRVYSSVKSALMGAMDRVDRMPDDKSSQSVLVFGSFFTVTEVMSVWKQRV